MWGNKTGCGSWARCSLLALWLLAAIAWAGAQDAPTTPPPSPSTTASSSPTMPSWDDLDKASAELSQKANDLVNQATDLNSQLEQLQSLLTQSQTLYTQSQSMRQQEEAAAQATIQAARNSGLWWERACLTFAGGFAGYLIDKWPGAAVGAGAGIATDAALELAPLFKIKL